MIRARIVTAFALLLAAATPALADEFHEVVWGHARGGEFNPFWRKEPKAFKAYRAAVKAALRAHRVPGKVRVNSADHTVWTVRGRRGEKVKSTGMAFSLVFDEAGFYASRFGFDTAHDAVVFAANHLPERSNVVVEARGKQVLVVRPSRWSVQFPVDRWSVLRSALWQPAAGMFPAPGPTTYIGAFGYAKHEFLYAGRFTLPPDASAKTLRVAEELLAAAKAGGAEIKTQNQGAAVVMEFSTSEDLIVSRERRAMTPRVGTAAEATSTSTRGAAGALGALGQ